jgi:hypothetical protein
VTLTTEHITAVDDLRHRAAPGIKTRDSMFWNVVLPEDQVAVQIYIWVDGDGVAGRQVAVYFPDPADNVILNAYNVDLGQDCDFDDWHCEGLLLRQPDPLRVAELTFAGEGVELEYRFTGRSRPFSYRENPAGCPPWMALNRFEQSGRAAGVLRVKDRQIWFDDVWTHRDHSWGRRNWGSVHHWKWIVAGAYDGSVELNAMFHVSRGEPGINGHIFRGDEPVPIVDGHCHAEYDEEMGQTHLQADLVDASGAVTHLEMQRYAIFSLPFGSDTLLSEAACRVTIDGVPGAGQFETLWPAGYIERLVQSQ